MDRWIEPSGEKDGLPQLGGEDPGKQVKTRFLGLSASLGDFEIRGREISSVQTITAW